MSCASRRIPVTLPLELRGRGSYVRHMKSISIFLAVALLAAPATLRAQDAATEERLNKLTAQIQDLVEAKDSQNKKIDALAKAVDALQQQLNKPAGNYASQEDVTHLAEKLQEVDKKRQDDNDRILKSIKDELKGLGSAPARSAPTRPVVNTGDAAPVPDKGFEYEVRSGDTLSVIVAAYKEKNIKITVDQILKANPGLVPEKMKVGQKIFIPAPTQ
jgi:LysM repeat protein